MWETIFGIALKLIGWYLDYSKASTEAKKAFLEFIKNMEPHNESCVKLRKEYLAQRDANLQKIKDLQNGNN